MKFKLIIEKTYEIDTDQDWGGDLSGLQEQLQKLVGSGETADSDDIHDALREMLEDHIDSVIGDEGLDANDFTIVVPKDTKLKVE